MNWRYIRTFPWLDTRAAFVARAPLGGSLLDIGSSDGETLRHIAELRPDLRLFATDLTGAPERYPAGTEFQRADIQAAKLRWNDDSIDVVTCMHLIEHLEEYSGLFTEIARLLKPGGRAYFETPHPRSLILSSARGAAAGTFTLNFYDDPTHRRPVPVGSIAQWCREAGLLVSETGISRNLLFAASWPLYAWLPASRQKFTAQTHWLGWSAYLIAEQAP